MRHILVVGAASVLLGLGLAAAFAQEPAAVDDGRIAKLIEQLDAPRFADRQAAQQELADLGKAVLPALEKALESENREIAGRSFEVIQRHFAGEDAAMKAAAKESLERLAKSPSESVARRAKDLLSPPKPPEPQNPQIPPGLQGLRIGGARVQIQVAGGGPNVKRVSIKEINGVKEIEAHENGRKVKIVDDPANGIKLEATETKDGKEETKKYEAKNADELKTKHPEAHKLYDEYSKAPAGIQVQGFQLGPGGIAPPAPGLNIRPIRRAKVLRPEELDAAKENIEGALRDLDATLETLRKEAEANGGLKDAVERTEAAKKRLEELKGKLES